MSVFESILSSGLKPWLLDNAIFKMDVNNVSVKDKVTSDQSSGVFRLENLEVSTRGPSALELPLQSQTLTESWAGPCQPGHSSC